MIAWYVYVYTTYVCMACVYVLTCTYVHANVYICMSIHRYVCCQCMYIHTCIHTLLIQQNFGYPNPRNKMSKKYSDKKNAAYITHYSYVEYSTLHVHDQVFSRMTELTFHIIECTNNCGLDNRASTVCMYV